MSARKLLTGATLALSCFTTGAMATDTSNGTVDFTGDIVDTPCIISSENSALKVSMDKVKASAFTDAGIAAPTDHSFDIKLDECDVTTLKNAEVTFTGSVDTTDNNLLAITGGAGAATGVGIELTENDGTPIVMGSKSAAAALQTGSNILTYKAHYKSTVKTVTPGAANAQAQFQVAYK